MSGDKELQAMGSVLSAMEPLEADERKRVVCWLVQKLGIEGISGRAPQSSPGNVATFAVTDKLDLSTDTIATIINAASGPDLIVAAAAHLHFAQGKAKFSRQELTAEMRTAPGHFKDTFINNLSKYLTGLTKADRLRLVAKDTYALANKTRQELETTLANA